MARPPRSSLALAALALLAACSGGSSDGPGAAGPTPPGGAEEAGAPAEGGTDAADASAADGAPDASGDASDGGDAGDAADAPHEADASPAAQPTVWSSETVPAPGILFRAIAATSADDVWAVGDAGSYAGATIAHWDGAAWSLVDHAGISGGLTGVWARSRDEVYVLTSAPGQVWRWDGHGWSEASTGSDFGVTYAYAIWGTATNLWVGSEWNFYTTPIHRFTGVVWWDEDTGSQDSVVSIGGDETDVWAVAAGTILHRAGSSWTTQWSGPGSVSAVAGAQHDAWAVGKQGLVLRMQLGSWKPAASGTTADLGHVWAADGTHALASGGAVIAWDGAAWAPVSGANAPAKGGAIGGAAADDVWISSGEYDSTLHHLHRVCGNGQREGVEACDGADLGGATCSSVIGKPATGALACTASCALDTSGCAYCGDGKANGTEACDGADLSARTCTDVLGEPATGTLACRADCSLDASACGACGDGKKNGAEPCDGADLGGADCAQALGKPATGALGCTAACGWDVSQCSYCGDGKRSAGETCEGADLGGWSCAGAIGAGASGAVGCSASCALDLAACTPTTVPCGDTSGLQPGAPWPMAGRCPAFQSRVDVIGPHAANEAWTAQGDFRGQPVVAADGTIYAADFAALVALAPDGSTKWRYAGGSCSETSPAIGADGTVYYVIGCAGALDAVKPDGTQLWRYSNADLGNRLAAPTIGGDGTIYVTGGDLLHAVRPDGTGAWTQSSGDSPSTSASIAKDGTLYYGTYGGRLVAVRPDGTLRWSLLLPGGSSASAGQPAPAVGPDGTIYVAAGSLFAVHPDGTIRWATARADFGSQPSIGVDGTLYLGSGATLVAVNPDGTTRWEFPVDSQNLVNDPPTIGGDGTLYFAGLWGDQLYALKPDGTVVWSVPSGYYPTQPVLAANGMLVYTSPEMTAFSP